MSRTHFEALQLYDELTAATIDPYPPDLRHLTSVFLGLLISAGQIGLPMAVFAALVCKKLTWHPVIINFCVIWTVYSIVFCLHIYARGAGAANQDLVCMVQACLINGAAPMAVVAGLAVVLHTWSTLQFLQCMLNRMPRILYLIMMLGTPYLVFIIFSVCTGTLVMSQPHAVRRNGLYCILQAGRPAAIVPSFCAAIMVIILALEAVITAQYYRQWKVIKASFPLATRTPSCSLCCRVGLFCLYSCVILTSAVLFLSDPRSEVTYMLPAALPLGALIIFGLREGVISLLTALLYGRHSNNFASSSEIEVPSARAASRSDPTLAPLELSEESPKESSLPV